MDDLIDFPPEGEEGSNAQDTDAFTIPDNDALETPAPAEEEKPAEGSEAEEKAETPAEEKAEDKAEEKEEEAEDVEFQKLLEELSGGEESIEKSEEAISNMEKTGVATDADITTLKEENQAQKDLIERMTEQVKKLSSDKSDLSLKNAELEAFGGDFTDPNLLIISRNLEKAKGGDDKSKSKVTTILKNMLEDLTGEDYESKKVNKAADVLSASESYNSNANPNIKGKANEDEDVMVM